MARITRCVNCQMIAARSVGITSCTRCFNYQKQTEPYHVPLIQVQSNEYPADRFEKSLPVMAEKMKAGEITLQQVIAQCQKTGQLTQDQLRQLESVAPVEISEEGDEVM